MRIQVSFAVLFAAVFACSMHAAPAQAQRVFVSGTGSDGNPCTFASPCRSFQHAHDTTAAGGEIDVLDPAGYGAVTITKAISIQGHGFSGVSVPSSGTGITINAGSVDAVHLNGLLIEGGQVGTTGIRFNSGGSLTVENCVVRNMLADGLDFFSDAATAQTLAVSNSYFNDNGGGIFIRLSNAGAIKAAIDRTGLNGNTDGLHIQATISSSGAITVGMTDSVVANNSFAGVLLNNTGALGFSNVSVTHSLVEGNAVGLAGEGTGGAIWIAQSTLTGNGNSFELSTNSVINTFGDNYFVANGAPTGSTTPVGKQ